MHIREKWTIITIVKLETGLPAGRAVRTWTLDPTSHHGGDASANFPYSF